MQEPIQAEVAGPFVVKYHRYKAAVEEEFDTLQEALDRASAIEDNGDGSVEAICEGGRIIYDAVQFSEYWFARSDA